jgi:hypothetical protein
MVILRQGDDFEMTKVNPYYIRRFFKPLYDIDKEPDGSIKRGVVGRLAVDSPHTPGAR